MFSSGTFRFLAQHASPQTATGFAATCNALRLRQQGFPQTSAKRDTSFDGERFSNGTIQLSSASKSALMRCVPPAFAARLTIVKDHTFKSLLFFAKIRFFSQIKRVARQFLFAFHTPSTPFFRSPEFFNTKTYFGLAKILRKKLLRPAGRAFKIQIIQGWQRGDSPVPNAPIRQFLATVTILYSERHPTFNRVSPCVQSCPVPRSVVPHPAFAEKYRDCDERAR